MQLGWYPDHGQLRPDPEQMFRSVHTHPGFRGFEPEAAAPMGIYRQHSASSRKQHFLQRGLLWPSLWRPLFDGERARAGQRLYPGDDHESPDESTVDGLQRGSRVKVLDTKLRDDGTGF